jgi:PAS domain S-box-containing protein
MSGRARAVVVLAAMATDLISFSSSAAPGTGDSTSPNSEWLIKAWETADGLPDNSATAIAQTPDGYIWFGTFNGLVRFNGVEFKTFDPSNTPQLPSDGIVNLHLDKAGRLLVSTYGGMAVLEGGEWKGLPQSNRKDNDIARSFADRSNGDVLVTMFKGGMFEFSHGKLSELPSPPGSEKEGYLGGADEEGHWWAVQYKFIGRLENRRWVSMISPPHLPRDAFAIAPARDGGMWLLMGNELCKLRRGVEVSRRILPQLSGGIWSMSEDSLSNVWIASYNQGFYRVSADGQVSQWNASNGWANGGRCVFEDSENNLWIGTSGDGLLRVTPRRFLYMDLLPRERTVIVQSLSADRIGGVWAATYGKGLFHLSTSGLTNLSLPDFMGDTAYLQSVLLDHADRIWLGTFHGPLQFLDETRKHRSVPKEIDFDNVLDLFEDTRGQVWFAGGSLGVGKFDGTSFQKLGAAEGLDHGGVTSFAEDASGALWVSTTEALLRNDREHHFSEVTDTGRHSIDHIASLKADQDGSMWLASTDRGLLRWKAGQLSHLDAVHGFPVTVVQSIVEDDTGCFWMTSGSSVVRARAGDLRAMADGRTSRADFQIFDANDGLPKAEFTKGRQPSCVRDARGRLWLAMTKGVAMVDPARLRINSRPPPVTIEEVIYHTGSPFEAEQEKTEHRARAPFPQQLKLPAGSRNIEIHYTALSFTSPEKVRFQIRLRSRGTKWQNVGNRRVAYLDELRPGENMFQVKAANDDGVWNDTGASLAFTMAPLFWQTAWFRLAEWAAVIGEAILILALLRAMARRRKAEESWRETEERMSLAAEAANLGMWMWDVPHGKIWATKKLRELFAFTPVESITLQKIQERIHPQDRDRRKQALERALQTGGTYDVEYRVIPAEGSQRWVASKGRAHRDDKGRPSRVLGVYIDITERRQAEDQAREVSGRLITAQEDERTRLARELHDDLSQSLALLSVDLDLFGQSLPGTARKGVSALKNSQNK